jgi:hypothetical protein
MNANQVLEYAREYYGEWLEMEPDPDKLLLQILSNQIADLIKNIEYLENRLKNAR